jgi:hypothetical protein
MKSFHVAGFVILFSMLCPFGQYGLASEHFEKSWSCDQWENQITASARKLIKVDQFSDDEIVQAISCLLRLKGNKNPSGFSGATSPEVSDILPHATVEIAALYYISYLFKGNIQHAYGVALVDKKGTYNSNEAVDIAYSAYRKWFERIKALGLAKAKAENLDPLKGTGVYWYGN